MLRPALPDITNVVCGTLGTLQGEQVALFAVAKVPTAQGNPTVFPVPGQYVPAGHAVQVEAPGPE